MRKQIIVPESNQVTLTEEVKLDQDLFYGAILSSGDRAYIRAISYSGRCGNDMQYNAFAVHGFTRCNGYGHEGNTLEDTVLSIIRTKGKVFVFDTISELGNFLGSY